MKIALVHELLTMRGGAEKVLRILAEMFPQAPIYTLLYDEKKLGDWFPRDRVRTSTVQKFAERSPLSAHRFNHHFYLSRFARAVEAWDFSEFDLVLSTSSAFVHGIITNGNPKHLCYVNSPARYLWDRTHDVLDRAGTGLLGPMRRAYLGHTFHKLRIWDSEAADRPDHLLAASKEVQRRVELYWRRDADVVYPPIDDFWFQSISSAGANRDRHLPQEKYFFIASTLVPYKKIDLAIRACNERGLPLKIAGEGPARAALENIAGSTVEFLGFTTQETLREFYTHATATIFPGEEDFGLVPLESMACGTPVIAYKKGGALETVVPGKTGLFFNDQTPAALGHVLGTFKKESFDPTACRNHARLFSRDRFEIAIRNAVESMLVRTMTGLSAARPAEPFGREAR
ncbi:glycosyltransferase [Candidatus Peregrinibacteria bacterium]|nr:glycosyltransferase [Candidatus Peregrinibacteria bacterium]